MKKWLKYFLFVCLIAVIHFTDIAGLLNPYDSNIGSNAPPSSHFKLSLTKPITTYFPFLPAVGP
jgi:hypothetical protein